MRVENANPIRRATGRAVKPGGGGSGFADALSWASETPGASGVTGSAPIGSLDALLAMQGVEDPTDGQRRARQRGEDILDRLDELRSFLLLGAVPRERVAQLAQMVRSQRDQVDDPRLARILDEIDLRAQVELAKLTTP